jgi:hypothetical protein
MNDALAFAFSFRRPDGKWGAVNDEHRRLVLTQYEVVAWRFAAALMSRGSVPIVPVRLTAVEIANVVISAGHTGDPMPHVRMIEEGLGWQDAEFRAADLAEELAGRVWLDTDADWHAAHVVAAEEERTR